MNPQNVERPFIEVNQPLGSQRYHSHFTILYGKVDEKMGGFRPYLHVIRANSFSFCFEVLLSMEPDRHNYEFKSTVQFN